MNNPLNNSAQPGEATAVRTEQFYRTRKLLLFLPLAVLPLLTLTFWNFHHAAKGASAPINTSQGIDASLPGAQFEKHQKLEDKMGFYTQAAMDSAKEQSKDNNPLLQQMGFKKGSATGNGSTMHNSQLTTAYIDPNVAKIQEKLAAINRQISQPQQAATMPSGTVNNSPDKSFNQQVNKLEMMMKTMNSGQGNDPQMQQLGTMLEKIEEIQHPELVKAPEKPASDKTDNPFKAIPAIIDGNQKVLQGGAVKLKLGDSLTIKAQVIPKGTLVFGTATITNQRLLLEIKNIRLGQAIIPVNLTVYAEDGMPGIPAPEAELAGAAGTGADNAMENMQLLSMDQGLATQAAAGGIDAAKGLFSKKVRHIKVHLKNGYAILLRNNDHNAMRP